MSNQRWREELMARYPTLFKVELGDRTVTPGYPAVGDGWRELVETAVSRIAAAIAAAPSGTVKIVQIKEKFGTLRAYRRSSGLDDAVKHAVDEAAALAAARSACTCERCGAEGRLYNNGGCLATACTEHALGKPMPVEPGFGNLHVVRTFDPPRFPIISCRRYVRETDSFVDVDPKSLGIEE